MSASRRNLFVVALLGSTLLWSGCSEDSASSFQEIEPRLDPVLVLDDFLMQGGQKREAFFTITSDMKHPELRANWTVLNREVFIDMYVVRAEDYDPNVPPPQQPRIFWSSVPEEGPLYGDRRGSAIILHPCAYDNSPVPACRPEGNWVVLFYNDNLATPATRTEVSATVNLRYFQ